MARGEVYRINARKDVFNKVAPIGAFPASNVKGRGTAMNSDGVENGGRVDQGWPGGFEWMGLFGRGQAGETMWRCDAMRAGRLYNRMLFDTQEEAEDFARAMRSAEPDQMFNVEAIKASQVWN
jgi:hypothetical protein